jgi:SagB-type dehydrogenase family enzyme
MAIEVAGIPSGVHYYDPLERGLVQIRTADLRRLLIDICLAQAPAESAAAAIVIGASLQRTMAKYGERGYRYVLLEAGHAAQNICLAAAELRQGLLPIGAFADEDANSALGLDGVDEAVLYILLMGNIPLASAGTDAYLTRDVLRRDVLES